MPRTFEFNNQTSQLSYDADSLLHFFHTLDSKANPYPIPPGELSIAFLSDQAIAKVHADFLSDPSPTDVITFPGEPTFQTAGEILVSIDHAQTASSQHNTTPQHELCLYLIHGWLHLAGLDDIQEPDRKKMRAAEQQLLSFIQTHNAFPKFTLKQKG